MSIILDELISHLILPFIVLIYVFLVGIFDLFRLIKLILIALIPKSTIMITEALDLFRLIT